MSCDDGIETCEKSVSIQNNRLAKEARPCNYLPYLFPIQSHASRTKLDSTQYNGTFV